jgi:hypothetical protein
MGDVTAEGLDAAIVKLNALAKSEHDEQAELFAKGVKGELTDEEKARLLELMGGKTEPEPLSKSATGALRESDTVQAGLAVSPFLKSFHDGIVEAVTDLGDALEKSSSVQNEFNLAMARAVAHLGELVKSQIEKVDTWASGSVEQPKAAKTPPQAAQALAKSMAGGAGEGEHLSKVDILDTLEAMHMESLQKGRRGNAMCGEDLQKSIAKYEQLNTLSQPLLAELRAYRSKK